MDGGNRGGATIIGVESKVYAAKRDVVESEMGVGLDGEDDGDEVGERRGE